MYRLVIGFVAACGVACQSPAPVEELVQPSRVQVPVDAVVSHPAKLQFKPLAFNLPETKIQVRELNKNCIAYFAVDEGLPLVKLKIMSPRGAFIFPKDNPALAKLAEIMLLKGGTKKLAPTQLTSQLHFLGSEIAVNVDRYFSSIELNTLAKHFPQSLQLILDMVSRGRYSPQQLKLAKKSNLRLIAGRNDDINRVQSREWQRLLLGKRHLNNLLPTKKHFLTAKNNAVRKYTRRVFAGHRLIFAVSGNVNIEASVKQLNAFVNALPKSAKDYQYKGSAQTAKAGLYGINIKNSQYTQVVFGHTSLELGSKDSVAMQVLNEVLGAARGSRLSRRLNSRSAVFGARSEFTPGIDTVGEFSVRFQALNKNVLASLSATLEQVNLLREQAPTQREIDIAKQSLLVKYQNRFQDIDAIVWQRVLDHHYGREDSFWQSRLEALAALTADDLLRVAKTHIHPNQFLILVLGDLQQVQATGGDFASLAKLFEKQLITITLPEPLSLRRN